MPRKRALAYIDERNDEVVSKLLTSGATYPVGYFPMALVRDDMRFAWAIVVQGHDLPDTPEGCELPRLEVEYTNGEIRIKGWNE